MNFPDAFVLKVDNRMKALRAISRDVAFFVEMRESKKDVLARIREADVVLHEVRDLVRNFREGGE